MEHVMKISYMLLQSTKCLYRADVKVVEKRSEMSESRVPAASPDNGPMSSRSIYDAILDDISSGKLTGGDRLKISELADRYGVSTSPVREALHRMQGEGFVEINRNRGATIKQADASTIQNIFEVLELLEPYFVSWFADYAQPEMVDELEDIQDQIANNPISDLIRFRKLDLEFHWLICKHHYNQRAAEIWKNLRQALIVHGAKLRIAPVRYEAIMEEHDELIASFRANDSTRADAAIRKHASGSFVQMSKQMRALGL